jgi:hypothetical protein
MAEWRGALGVMIREFVVHPPPDRNLIGGPEYDPEYDWDTDVSPLAMAEKREARLYRCLSYYGVRSVPELAVRDTATDLIRAYTDARRDGDSERMSAILATLATIGGAL